MLGFLAFRQTSVKGEGAGAALPCSQCSGPCRRWVLAGADPSGSWDAAPWMKGGQKHGGLSWQHDSSSTGEI